MEILKQILVWINNLIFKPSPKEILQPVSTTATVSPVVTPIDKTNKIYTWAHAIAKWEGDSSGVNPGNLKYTTLTKTWGATQGRPAQDGGYFALFVSYGVGFSALCNFLTLACEGELIIAHKPCTFEQFTIRYAGNPPQNYIDGIREIVGCELSTDISSFLG